MEGPIHLTERSPHRKACPPHWKITSWEDLSPHRKVTSQVGLCPHLMGGLSPSPEGHLTGGPIPSQDCHLMGGLSPSQESHLWEGLSPYRVITSQEGLSPHREVTSWKGLYPYRRVCPLIEGHFMDGLIHSAGMKGQQAPRVPTLPLLMFSQCPTLSSACGSFSVLLGIHWFGATPWGPQGLLLSVLPGITPDKALGAVW